MKKRWQEALRSLARHAQEPFQAIAYGVTETPEGDEKLREDLRICAREHHFETGAEIVAEVADPFTGAVQRPLFKSRVLGGIGFRKPSLVDSGRPVPVVEDARRSLEAVSVELSKYLNVLASGGTAPQSGHPFKLPPQLGRGCSERAYVSSPRRNSIVLVRRFEDLGGDAEAIAGSIEAIVRKGGHLLVATEGLDTRTREGRAIAAVTLRLGGIKAERARVRSLDELQRRRRDLQVYGPIPFGFTRGGQDLVPVPEQMETVLRLRELAGRGVSPFETALVLNRERRTWKDGSPWTRRRVGQVLRNPIYELARREEIA